MRFKNKSTGVIIGTSNEFVIEQMKKSAEYEEIKMVCEEVVIEKEATEKKPRKADKKNK